MLNESRRDQNAHSFCQDPTHCILYFGCVRACFIWSTVCHGMLISGKPEKFHKVFCF